MSAGPAFESDENLERVVRSLRRAAVLGVHPNAARPAHYVPKYLAEQGVEIFGVNPRFVGEELFGNPVVATLAELDVEVDVVDVFRPSQAIPTHADDVLAMRPAPKVVWLQLGIRHDETAERGRAAGIEVIQDRCLLVDHRRFA